MIPALDPRHSLGHPSGWLFHARIPLNPLPRLSLPSPLTNGSPQALSAAHAGDLLLPPGSEHTSAGGQHSYRILGPCCRLFDREELPWPCCRLAWRSKEPSWRRIGRRFVPDLAARRCPSYAVELLLPGARPTRTVVTLFPVRLQPALQEWWYSKLPASFDPANVSPPLAAVPNPAGSQSHKKTGA